MADIKKKKCVICGKEQAEKFMPFCSARCADVDLARWVKGTYAIPVEDNGTGDANGSVDAPPSEDE